MSSGIPPLDWLVPVASGLAALAIFVTLFKWAQRKWSRIEQFLDDWNGIPARPGVPASPGVMERLHNLETSHCASCPHTTPTEGVV